MNNESRQQFFDAPCVMLKARNGMWSTFGDVIAAS